MATKEDFDKLEKFIKNAANSPNKVERATQRYGELKGRRGTELDLWHRWNDSGREAQHLEPLLKSIDPLIKSETRSRMKGLGGSISAPALHQELRNAAVKSFESYDPNKGKLSTHVVGNFRRITSFIAQNRNAKYMPKEDVERWGTFNNAATEFREEHGREPTAEELHAKLPGWQLKHVAKMQRGFGSEVFTDMGTDLENDATDASPMQRIRGAVMLMHSELTPEERQFAELHYPEEGVDQLSVQSIAKSMKIPSHKAYRIKKRIESKLAPVIKNQ